MKENAFSNDPLIASSNMRIQMDIHSTIDSPGTNPVLNGIGDNDGVTRYLLNYVPYVFLSFVEVFQGLFHSRMTSAVLELGLPTWAAPSK